MFRSVVICKIIIFPFKFGSSTLPQAVGKKSQLFPNFRSGGTLLFDTWSPLSAEESGLVGLSSPPGRDSHPTTGCTKKIVTKRMLLEPLWLPQVFNQALRRQLLVSAMYDWGTELGLYLWGN